MIKRLIFYLIGLCLVVALILYNFGVRRVELGTEFISFLTNVSRNSANFKLEIPQIPLIEIPHDTEWWDILGILSSIGNMFVGLVNTLASVINWVLGAIAWIISLVQCFFEFITQLSTQVPNVPSLSLMV